ncbi:MAG: DUF998 domain-containing protein [Candidatus Berkelbacteria bacterium]|nr:DUF998 domain-containing protein [Candidatus Berkelbacteria bacterium]
MKKFKMLGILGAIIYLATIVIGGFLRDGYTPFIDPVSRIFARGLPHSNIIVSLFVLSNFTIVLFAIGIINFTKNISFRSGMISLIFAGITGSVLFVFFPMDPWMGVRTPADVLHNNIVTVMALFILFSMFLVYIGSKKEKIWQRLSNYFLISTILYFIAGTASGICLKYYWGLIGTFESLWIIIFLQWLVVIAYHCRNISNR